MSILYTIVYGHGAFWIGSDYTANNFPLVSGTESIWLVPGTF
jgi:hypothetical protein